MSLDQASFTRAAPRGKGDGEQWPDERQSASSSEASSLSPTTVAPRRTRLTPDTGSEDDDDAENEEVWKDGGEGYELQERAGQMSDEDEMGRRSDDQLRSPRRRRRRQRQRLLYTAEEETSVVRKFDRRLVIFMAVLYLLSFLDRSSMFFSTSATRGMPDMLI